MLVLYYCMYMYSSDILIVLSTKLYYIFILFYLPTTLDLDRKRMIPCGNFCCIIQRKLAPPFKKEKKKENRMSIKVVGMVW